MRRRAIAEPRASLLCRGVARAHCSICLPGDSLITLGAGLSHDRAQPSTFSILSQGSVADPPSCDDEALASPRRQSRSVPVSTVSFVCLALFSISLSRSRRQATCQCAGMRTAPTARTDDRRSQQHSWLPFFFGHRLRARWGLVLHLTGRSMAGSFVSIQVSVTWLMSSYPRWWSHQENPQLRLSAVPPSS